MIIAGAGGHGLEIKEELELLNPSFSFTFFDHAGFKVGSPLIHLPLIQDLEGLQKEFRNNPRYALGVGKPEFREKFVTIFTEVGGEYFPVHAKTAQVSSTATGVFDAMAFSFVGPNVQLGTGVLINSRANIHHDSLLGDYTEIGPSALILGGVKIGKKCRIGAGAVILPGVQLGDNVVVGAGAVVTRNIDSGSKVVGIPARLN